MGKIVLWGSLGVVGIVAVVFVLKCLDKLLLRAEEKGWIYYRKKSAGGIVACVAPNQAHLGRFDHSARRTYT